MAVQFLSFMPGFGFGLAATTLVGQSLVANNPDLAELFGYETNRFATLFIGCMAGPAGGVAGLPDKQRDSLRPHPPAIPVGPVEVGPRGGRIWRESGDTGPLSVLRARGGYVVVFSAKNDAATYLHGRWYREVEVSGVGFEPGLDRLGSFLQQIAENPGGDPEELGGLLSVSHRLT